MRSAGNFSTEWGYLAPAPSFARTARVVLVATAIGAIAGAGVVFSLVDRPAEPEKTPLAGRAIVTSVRATAIASPTLAANGPAVTGGAASAALPSSPTQSPANLEAPRSAVAVTMPPTPPASPTSPTAPRIAPPIAASSPIAAPALARPAPTRPASLTRSVAAHPPGAPPGLGASAAPVLRGRSVAVNAPAGATAAPAAVAVPATAISSAPANTASAPPKASSALASAGPPAAMPTAPASVPDVAPASAAAASDTGAGEAPAIAPIAPTDANGNPSIVAPETTPPKKDKRHASGKKGQLPGIGTILRRFFVAHSGRTYYPSNRGLSN
jgi:hypothetical protein